MHVAQQLLPELAHRSKFQRHLPICHSIAGEYYEYLNQVDEHLLMLMENQVLVRIYFDYVKVQKQDAQMHRLST